MTMTDHDTAAGPAEWDDLGDDELLRRLTQRGIRFQPARRLVADRDRSALARRCITEALAR
jgi:hypothetical protein